MSCCVLPFLIFLGLFALVSCDQQESSVEKASKAGILIIGNNTEPQSIDPHKATSVADGKIISCLLEGLVRPDAKDATLIHPGMAERWERNETASEWTFHLREAQWSDGRPVRAQDFLYAWQRMLHPQFGAKYAEMLYVIKNAEAYNKGECAWEELGVIATDSRTLRITLEGPTPQLLQLMLHYTWSPIPAHAVEAQGGMLDRSSTWAKPQHWVGNGAYVLGEHRYNDFLEVKASPTYWRKEELRNKGIRFLPIVNGFTETRMFFDGKLHISNNVPPEMIAMAQSKGGDNYHQDPYYATSFYRLNCTRGPLKDVRVRRALSLAIDRESLVQRVVRGAGELTYTFTPEGAGYTAPEIEQAATQAEREELARALLAEAGYPEGRGFPVIELMTTSREVQRIMAECIQAMWLKVLNIRIEIRSCEWTAYKAAQQKMEYDISASSWTGDYLDPATFVELWRSGGGNNSTGWGSAVFDTALAAAQQSPDTAERFAHLRTAEAEMLKAHPIIPLYWTQRCFLMHSGIKGMYPLLLDNHPLDAVEPPTRSKTP